MKLQITTGVNPATEDDVERFASSSRESEVARSEVNLGEFTGVVVTLNREKLHEERIIARSKKFLLFSHISADNLEVFRDQAFPIIAGMRTKEANTASHGTLASSRP